MFTSSFTIARILFLLLYIFLQYIYIESSKVIWIDIQKQKKYLVILSNCVVEFWFELVHLNVYRVDRKVVSILCNHYIIKLDRIMKIKVI